MPLSSPESYAFEIEDGSNRTIEEFESSLQKPILNLMLEIVWVGLFLAKVEFIQN